jgi:hypothetical protein
MPIANVGLSINVGSNPIQGVLISDDGAQPFFGWVELAAVIEAVRAADTAPGNSGETPNWRRGR